MSNLNWNNGPIEFMLRRTSYYGQRRKGRGLFSDYPLGLVHERATIHDYISVDKRYTDDPNKIPLMGLEVGEYKDYAEAWYSEGTNHRLENNCIKRDFEAEGNFITFKSIGELLDFAMEVGRIVIEFEHDTIPEYPIIEIYDHWRE